MIMNAIKLLFFVVLSFFSFIIPAITTVWPSLYFEFSSSSCSSINSLEVIVETCFIRSSCSDKGWPLKYIPSISFSKANRYSWGNSFTSGRISYFIVSGIVSLKELKSETCPSMFLLRSCCIPSIVFSYAARSWALYELNPSKTPDFIILSTALLFSSLLSIFSQKSIKLVNSFSFLVVTIVLIIPDPTFLIAWSPNLMLFSSTVNFPKLLFTLGFNISIPNLLQSLIYWATLVEFPITLVIKAAMNSTG